MGSCAQGALSRLLVQGGASPRSFDSSSEIYDFRTESIQKHGRIVGAHGITGSRSQLISRTRIGSYLTGGSLSMDTCSADLTNWLPRILGGSAAGNVFSVADSLPEFDIMLNRVGGVFQYTNCKVNRAIWRGSGGPGDAEPEIIEMMLEVAAETEDPNVTYPGTPPTLSQAANRNPYILADGVLTIDGTAYEFRQFVLALDNMLEPRWVNSITPTALCPQDRQVTLRVATPFTATEFAGLYDLAAAGTGVAASLKFSTSSGAYSTDFAFTNLQWADTSPFVPGKRDIPLYIDFICRLASGSTSEITVTNDST